MDPDARETLLLQRKQFEGAVPWGGALCEALEKYEFVPTHFRPLAGTTWFVRIHPPRALQEGFGLAPEVLLVVVDGEVLARDLAQASDEVIRSGLRLDANLVVVTDRPRSPECTSPLSERLRRIRGTGQRVAWVEGPCGWPDLANEFRRQLPTTDIFDEFDAVRGDQLMGRSSELGELRTRVARGDAVGVFGLRKVGKTSLVRAVTDRLDPASGVRTGAAEPPDDTGAIVIWYDVGNLQHRHADALADALLGRLRHRMGVARTDWTPPSQGGLPGLQETAERLLDAGRHLCVVLDEYDLLFEDEDGGGAVSGLNRFFRSLRGWAQQWQGSTSLVLIGRDPEHVAQPHLGGVTNPLLAWFKPFWLGPLKSPGDRELLRRLGRRVGLDVGPRTADLAREWTGGHPLLHRQFGAALHEEIRDRKRETGWEVPTDAHSPRVIDAFLSRQAVLEVQREIMALLDRRYPEASRLLESLADTGSPAPAESVRPGDPMLTLLRFGLIDEVSRRPPRYLAEYIQRLLPRASRAARMAS